MSPGRARLPRQPDAANSSPRPLLACVLGDSLTVEQPALTRLVQVRILVPQPASRTHFAPAAALRISSRHSRQLAPVSGQFRRPNAAPFRGRRGQPGFSLRAAFRHLRLPMQSRTQAGTNSGAFNKPLAVADPTPRKQQNTALPLVIPL